MCHGVLKFICEGYYPLLASLSFLFSGGSGDIRYTLVTLTSYPVRAPREHPGIFDWRGPESRDYHVFNAGRTKLLYENRQESTSGKITLRNVSKFRLVTKCNACFLSRQKI